ncbi:uncharacterized protein [Eurosta solidaginis]|uniref:uncharacterized protein isoform X2 n=1 Tax=Eurosta solidaginis TaxID=178769 RepID=UPI0035308929
MAPTKKIDLNIDVDVLTAGSTADVVNAILEFLLFQRHQIPFVYNTFKYYVGLWSESEESASSINEHLQIDSHGSSICTLNAFKMQRQRKQALQTKEAITAMRELIKKSFEINTVRSLRFLFGSTTFTAKEAYTIHIPIDSISPLHYHNHHRIPNARLNQTLISLLTGEELFNIFSLNLSPTNLYLELEMSSESENAHSSCANAQLLPKDVCQLPPSCKDIHIHLQHSPYPVNDDDLTLNCCKELEVFDEKMCLNVDDSDKKNLEFGCKQNKQSSCTWWEADILVKFSIVKMWFTSSTLSSINEF